MLRNTGKMPLDQGKRKSPHCVRVKADSEIRQTGSKSHKSCNIPLEQTKSARASGHELAMKLTGSREITTFADPLSDDLQY
jgi:hypothetical protein